MKLCDANLTLFFTADVGLKTWADIGSMGRETAIYRRLSEHLNSVNFVTYGGKKEKEYANALGRIRVYPVSWTPWIPLNICQLILYYRKMLMQSDVFKTNQIYGSQVAVRLKRRFGKKLIVRCGYLLSRQAEISNNEAVDSALAHKLERYAFLNADYGVLTTEINRQHIINTYNVDPDKVVVIPNFVDTDIFKPRASTEKEYDIVFVGRTGKEKNLKSLLEAVTMLQNKRPNLRLLLVGGCASDANLRRIAMVNRLNVAFQGNTENELLPEVLNKGNLFILPSLYEGHPKVLLEAMSCGLPCIGTDVEGIRELIKHGETGYLCKTDAQSIANAIEVVLSDEVLRRKIGQNARRYIIENFALEKILNMELDVIRRVIAT